MRVLAVALALAVSSACEIDRPIELHPDAIALYVVLVAGESEARMLAVHPHRENGEPAPDITATLEGPGWSAPFADTLEWEACGFRWYGRPPRWCLGAVLPDTIRAGGVYGLRGTAPLGSFAGEMKMPAPPLLLEPADSLHVVAPAEPGEDNDIRIPIRYRIDTDVGTLMADMLDFFEIQEDGSEVRLPDSRGPYPVDGAAGTDWMVIRCIDPDILGGRRIVDLKPVGFSFRLLGIGWHYTRFVELRVDYRDHLLKPWPAFGIEGEEVYGFFDGLTPSRSARIVVAPETGCVI